MSSPSSTRGAGAPSWLSRALLPTAIGAAVLALYLPTLGFPFFELDDLYFVVENPGLRDLSFDGLRFLFLEDERDFRWFPLTYLSFAINRAVTGMDAASFRAVNVGLHLANTILVFVLIRRLSGSGLVAGVTSLLFGIHPLQLESVVWINSRKNVLFFFFFLISAGCYLRHARLREEEGTGSPLAFAASWVAFAFAVMAKTAAVPLPGVLVLIDHHVARDLPRSPLAFLARSLPSKLLYLPVIGVAWFMTNRLASLSPFLHEYDFSAVDWAVIVAHNFFFYVAKAIAPVGLAVFYPLPDDQAPALPGTFYVFALAAVALLAFGIAAYRTRRNVLFGVGWYFATILPMAVLPFFFSDMPMLAADRYLYQSAVGLFFLFATGVAWAWKRGGVATRVAAGAVVGLAILGCTLRTLEQRGIWESTRSVYEETVRHHPSDAFFYRLAIVQANDGDLQAALESLERAEGAPHQIFFTRLFAYQLRISDLYRRQEDFERAARFLADALESAPNAMEPFDPRTPLAYRHLADLHLRAGDPAAAAEATRRAREVPALRDGRFETLWFTVAPDESRRLLERRLAEAPYDAAAWQALGRWHEIAQEPEEARDAFDRARQLGVEFEPAAP